MKYLKHITLLTLASVGFLTSCSPDYVENSSPVINPSNPSSQSIQLNFTSGNFIGVMNNAQFQNGIGVATQSSLGGEPVYLLQFTNGTTNQFNASISGATSGTITGSTDKKIVIYRDNKMYDATSGTYQISQIQLITSQMGIDIIKCKFTFNGEFNVESATTFESLETGVKINGTVIF